MIIIVYQRNEINLIFALRLRNITETNYSFRNTMINLRLSPVYNRTPEFHLHGTEIRLQPTRQIQCGRKLKHRGCTDRCNDIQARTLVVETPGIYRVIRNFCHRMYFQSKNSDKLRNYNHTVNNYGNSGISEITTIFRNFSQMKIGSITLLTLCTRNPFFNVNFNLPNDTWNLEVKYY